jgi:predicted RNA-binding protein with PIN domain
VIVDAMNVIGSRPTGWWRDRRGAIRDFVARLRAYADHHEAPVTVVIDGRPLPELPEGGYGHLEVRYARRAGANAADDRIVDLVRDLQDAPHVITADRGLRERVHALGATTAGPSTLLHALDELGQEPGTGEDQST